MTTQTTTQQQLQKSYETSLEEYKDVFRYWHAVLTLQRPIDYGVWFGVILLAFMYVATRDWSLTTTLFLGVFFYFLATFVLDMVGGIPYAKLAKTNYELSESDPFVFVAKYLALAHSSVEHLIGEMKEFRRANRTLFTVQVCGASLVLAFLSSFFSGFTLAFLLLVTIFAGPPIVVLHLHEQAWAKLEPILAPHIETARSKLAPYIPMLAKKSSDTKPADDAAKAKKSS